MRTFNIPPLDPNLGQRLREKIDRLSKPLGALGQLERLAVQVGQIQGTLTPTLRNPHNIIFAADHGIAAEGISKSPKEVTWQVVLNMLSGGAGVCYLARQHGIALRVVDVGVEYNFANDPRLVHRKIRPSTRSYLYEAAMTEEELVKAVEIGCTEVDLVYRQGCNTISFGEMGITNTSSSSLWMHLLTGIPLEACIGRGSGLDDEGMKHKYTILSKALSRYRELHSGELAPCDILSYFGGYEMVSAVGAMLRAAELRMVILVDGFIMSACMLAASHIAPGVLDYAVYGHQGDEAGHAKLLSYLAATPLLHLGLRLGEGSGSVCAYPIVQSAVLMLSDMASFDEAGVVNYTTRSQTM